MVHNSLVYSSMAVTIFICLEVGLAEFMPIPKSADVHHGIQLADPNTLTQSSSR